MPRHPPYTLSSLTPIFIIIEVCIETISGDPDRLFNCQRTVRALLVKAIFCRISDACVGAKPTLLLGGDERNRTADPLLAKQVLSRLSYIPHAHCG